MYLWILQGFHALDFDQVSAHQSSLGLMSPQWDWLCAFVTAFFWQKVRVLMTTFCGMVLVKWARLAFDLLTCKEIDSAELNLRLRVDL